MARIPPIVNYASLNKAFVDNLDSFQAAHATGEEAGEEEQMTPAQLIAFISSGMQRLEKAQGDCSAFVSVDDRTSSLLQTFLAQCAAQTPGKVVDGEMGPEAKFDSNDILGWARSLLDWLKGLRKHEFISHNDAPEKIGNMHRMALLGDWGTGMYGAPVCAESIRTDGAFDMLLHLGDVYYSGDKDEVQERFLNAWPKVDGAVNRALNSNHEMYAGGYGYFGMTLRQFGQKASYFAVQNDHWLLVGLDTGYAEHDLYGNQKEWLYDLVRNAGERKIILFSHHQPYSYFESQGEKLIEKLGSMLDANRVFAWYWGHEHRCVVFDRHPVWGIHGRCIGHSGFPYFRNKFTGTPPLKAPGWVMCKGRNLVPGCRVLDGPNKYIGEDADKYGPNGYAALEFNDAELVEVIFDADGTDLYRQKLT